MKGLLVVDMQNDFLDLEKGALNLGHDTTELQNRVATFIKNFEGDIVISYDSHRENSCEFELLPPHCIEGTWGHELAGPIKDSLKRADALGMGIGFKNSFAGDEVLNELGESYEELHVVGVCTSICVHDLVSAYVNRVKNTHNKIPKVIIHRDMVDDFDQEASEFTLKRLQTLYGVEVR